MRLGFHSSSKSKQIFKGLQTRFVDSIKATMNALTNDFSQFTYERLNKILLVYGQLKHVDATSTLVYSWDTCFRIFQLLKFTFHINQCLGRKKIILGIVGVLCHPKRQRVLYFKRHKTKVSKTLKEALRSLTLSSSISHIYVKMY